METIFPSQLKIYLFLVSNGYPTSACSYELRKEALSNNYSCMVVCILYVWYYIYYIYIYMYNIVCLSLSLSLSLFAYLCIRRLWMYRFLLCPYLSDGSSHWIFTPGGG